MNEYLVHYKDKENGKISIFYFVDYKDLNMLLNDLEALNFEESFGEVLDMEKVVIDEFADMPVSA